MGKPKYQLPHYDRVHPSVRVGLRAGALAQQAMIQMGRIDGGGKAYDIDVEGLVRDALKPTSRYGTWDTIPEESFWEVTAGFLQSGCFPAASDPATANFIAAEMIACHLYDLYGRQVYTLSPIIHEMFDNTDLGALTLGDVKMPFDCFYVSLQKPRFGVDGFYVYKTPEEIAFVAVGFSGEVEHSCTARGGPAPACTNEVWPADTIDVSPSQMEARGSYFRFFFTIGLDSFSEGVPVGRILDLILEGGSIRGEWMHDPENVATAAKQTRMMVMTFFNLLFFLNADERSVLTYDERDEKAEAESTVDRLSGRRGTRKRAKRREAKERLKYLTTARYTRVGVAQEEEITSRPGFSMDQPRHWRRGHFHRYWTGPLKIDGVKIPFSEWEDKRTLVRQWLIPVLINPDAEIEEVTHRTVVKESQEALACEVYKEGAEIVVPEQTKRERPGSKCRQACLDYHGRICQLCSDDGARFGGAGGWLHVHHLDPLGDAVAERDVDPIEDMIPLCATCHGFIHSQRPALGIEQARAIIERNKREAE